MRSFSTKAASMRISGTVSLNNKRRKALARYTIRQFIKNTVYLERGMPFFVFANAVLVKKNDVIVFVFS